MEAHCISCQFIMERSHRGSVGKKEIEINGIRDQKGKTMIMMSYALCNRVGSL